MIRAQRIRSLIFVLLLLTGLPACNSMNMRIASAEQLAQANEFKKATYSTALFNIVSFQRVKHTEKTITVFIEGDGLAWSTKRRISANPTPNNPVALKLAVADRSGNIVYLARPCQYIDINTEPNCQPEYWTSKRASKAVVQSLSNALDQIKQKYKTYKIRLVGYSGGATIAAILAAQREDVLDLRTIAGNLDIETFANYHKVTPLYGSINPVDYAEELIAVPQLHFYSLKDSVIVPDIIESYVSALKKYDAQLHCVALQPISGATHETGWFEQWQTLSTQTTACSID